MDKEAGQMLHLPKRSERQRSILKALANGELILEEWPVCGLRWGAGRREVPEW